MKVKSEYQINSCKNSIYNITFTLVEDKMELQCLIVYYYTVSSVYKAILWFDV